MSILGGSGQLFSLEEHKLLQVRGHGIRMESHSAIEENQYTLLTHRYMNHGSSEKQNQWGREIDK
jgi:hypothetical protein